MAGSSMKRMSAPVGARPAAKAPAADSTVGFIVVVIEGDYDAATHIAARPNKIVKLRQKIEAVFRGCPTPNAPEADGGKPHLRRASGLELTLGYDDLNR